MTNSLSKIKRFLKQLRGFIPEPLPAGMTEFNTFVDDVMTIYDLPTKDRDSVAFSLASMIMHLGPTVAYKPKMYFVITLRSACAKQVAGAAFYQIKQKQKAAEEAVKAEAIAQAAAASNDQSS